MTIPSPSSPTDPRSGLGEAQDRAICADRTTCSAVRGDGCQGPEYGVGLAIRDPSGQEIDGDGGLAQPDGTWQLEEHFGHYRAAGTYTFEAGCNVTNGPSVFSYAPAPFVWAG
jgi:hypothetical protein